jgi:hypothetical protein
MIEEPNPLRDMARAIKEQAEANFLDRFGKPITVRDEVVQDPGERPRVVFTFTLDRPGLLPTALERHWFDGFIDGYRCCSNVIRFLLEPGDDDATN